MKVFVTVGSMLPFERLIRSADEWTRDQSGVEVIAQTGGGSYKPRWMQAYDMVPPARYRELCAWADVIVSHLGMGTVITAAEVSRPLVALPRRPELEEVTSDHQVATSKWLKDKPGVVVVESEGELAAAIAKAASGQALADLGTDDRQRLLLCVRAFVKSAIGNA